jgi:hypothetical protein
MQYKPHSLFYIPRILKEFSLRKLNDIKIYAVKEEIEVDYRDKYSRDKCKCFIAQ